MLRKREPTSPGEILLEEFMKPLGLTQRRLADHLGCDVKVINRIVNGRTGVTPEMAFEAGCGLSDIPRILAECPEGGGSVLRGGNSGNPAGISPPSELTGP